MTCFDHKAIKRSKSFKEISGKVDNGQRKIVKVWLMFQIPEGL